MPTLFGALIMWKLSLGATVLALFTYYQNLGVITFPPNAKVPDRMKEVMGYVNRILSSMAITIPHVPNFDVMFQLALLAVIVPFLLDVTLVWFLSPRFKIVVHFLIAAAVFFLTYAIGAASYGDWSGWVFCAGGVGFLVLFTGVVFLIIGRCTREKKVRTSMNNMITDVSRYMMSDLTRDRPYTGDIGTVVQSLKEYSDVTRIIPAGHSPYVTAGIMIAAGVVLVLSTWMLGFVPIVPSPPEWGVVIPAVGYLVAILLGSLSIARMFKQGRSVITAIKRGVRRYGLWMLMLCLQLVYLPCVSLLVDLLIVSKYACPDGTYMNYTYDNTTIVAPYVNRTFVCTACTVVSDFCQEKCHEKPVFRVMTSPGIALIDDIAKPFGCVILYVVLVFVIGVPVFIGFVISVNRRVLANLYVYGRSVNQKWDNLCSRLVSTGFYLFCDYDWKYSHWSMVQILMKVCATVLAGCVQLVGVNVMFGFPILYGGMIVLLIGTKPYRYRFNNVLETVVFALLFVFSFVPILVRFGVDYVHEYEQIITWVFMGAPVISVFGLIGRKREDVQDFDPTLLPKSQEEKVRDEQNMDDAGNVELDDIIEMRIGHSGDNEDEETFAQRDLCSLNEEIAAKKASKSSRIVNSEEPVDDADYKVSRTHLAKRVTGMYAAIDLIMDGFTTDLIMRALSVIVVVSFVGFGLYIGISQARELPGPYYC